MPKSARKRLKNRRKSWPLITAFVVVFAAIGSYLLLTSHAASTPNELQLALNRSFCLDNYGNSSVSQDPIVIWTCNSSDHAQQWTVENVSGGFLLEDAAGTCADDTGDGVGTTASSRVYLQTYTCNSSDHAQVWKWTGSAPSELQNAYNNGCINDPANSTSNGTQLIVYPCSPATNNAEWFEASISSPPPTPSVSITSPASGATVSGSNVLVSAKASVSSGSITDLTITVAGTTLASCANATTCFGSWNSTGVGNGTYTVQATTTASSGGSAQSSEKITVSNSTSSSGSNPSPSPGSGGGGSSSGSGSGSGSGSSSGSGPTPVTGGANAGPTVSDSYYSSGSGVNFNTSGDANGDSVSLNSSSNDGSPDLSVSEAPTDTLGNGDSSGAPSSDGAPTVYDIVPTKITTNSISLSWGGADATSYKIKYGTNSASLTVTRTLTSSAMEPSYTITSLPANTMIYVSITPSSSGTAGTAESASIKTLKPSSPVSVIILAVVILGAAGTGIVVLRRKMGAADAAAPTVEIAHLPVYPREDAAEQTARVDWWLPENQRQAIASHQQAPPKHHNSDDDYPDMYVEGRKRLEDEEKQRRFPGE